MHLTLLVAMGDLADIALRKLGSLRCRMYRTRTSVIHFDVMHFGGGT